MDLARRTAERVARDSYGRLVAILSARTRDIASAEDALAEALLSALRTWPDRGVPANPDGWLLTAARNTMKNAARHDGVTRAALPDLLALRENASEDGPAFPDERLKLLFVCAHPAIDEGVRTPLMLQTILGLDAALIGAAFLVPPATMGQRLVRAKAKIRDAGLRFALPSLDEMSDRLAEVLDAVYAAYGAGWDAHDQPASSARGLTDEAIYLGRLIASLMPGQPEAAGLLALMLYCEARRDARRDASGAFVPLDRQDASLWRRDLIIEAEGLLTAASRFGQFGRYQCLAAIQSVHVQRPLTGRTHHDALLTLYRMLVERYPAIGARVGLAAVLVEAGRGREALRELDDLDQASVEDYQPYWVTRARALHAVCETGASRAALATAIDLTQDEPTRAFIRSLLNHSAPYAPG